MNDLRERVRQVFSETKVKRPFSTDTELLIVDLSDAELDGVVQRLQEVWTEGELEAMDQAELVMAVKRVWELVRWIHYN